MCGIESYLTYSPVVLARLPWVVGEKGVRVRCVFTCGSHVRSPVRLDSLRSGGTPVHTGHRGSRVSVSLALYLLCSVARAERAALRTH